MKKEILFRKIRRGGYLILFLFVSLAVSSQSEIVCESNDSLVPEDQRGTGCEVVDFFDLSDYIDNSPRMEVSVVFHFVADNQGANFIEGPLAENPWDTNPLYGSYRAWVFMLGINNRLQDVLRENIPQNPPQRYDSNIRFVFRYPLESNLNFRYYNSRSQVQTVDDALNIIISGTQINGGEYKVTGYVNSLGYGNTMYLVNVAKRALDLDLPIYQYESLMIHEWGHLMGLNHSFHCNNSCNGIAFNFPHNDREECCGVCKSHNGSSGQNCFGCSSMVMGYGAQAELSVCEMNTIWTNYLRRNTEYINICNNGNTISTYSVTGNEPIFWDATRVFNSDVVLESGVNLTVRCNVLMGPGTKFLIKKGAILTIDGGQFSTYCADQWQGIVIEGNGADQSGAGKLVMTNNAIIENAVDGISLNPTHIPWPDLASSWGGLVEASNSTIRNCNRAVAFMKMPNDRSFFNDCTFQNLNEGVTLWDNKGVNFLNCTFTGIQKSALLTYDSSISAIENTMTGVRDGVELISTGATANTSLYLANTIDAQRYAFDGTAPNGLKVLRCEGNTLMSNNAAFNLNGISNYRLQGNNIIGADFGSRLSSTGTGQWAEVVNNTFSSTWWGSLVNHETNTEYQSNCFYYNGGDIQVNTGEINSMQGDPSRAANNCFTKNGAPSMRVINSASFDYHLAHIETPTCKTPTEYQDPNRGYELEWGAPESVVDCSDPVYIKYRRCPLPKNAEDYAKMKKELEDEIKKIEADENMSQTMKDFLIKRYKNCLRKIQREIIIIILEEDDPAKKQDAITNAVNIAQTSEFFELNILGFPILMDHGMYAEAAVYLNQMNTSENSDALDYVTIQSINLGYYNNIGNYQLSLTDKNTLYNIGLKTKPIAGYARGLYYKLTGEKMEVDWIYEGSLVEFRNKKETENKDLLIDIYPNPVDNNVLNILLNHKDMDAGIKAAIYDTQGNIVKNLDMSGQNHITMDVSDMVSGVYIISFLKDGQWVKTQRFIKL